MLLRLGTIYIVVEFAPHGNLRQFLRSNRPSFTESLDESSESSLTVANLVSFALQIAKGMEFLASHQVSVLLFSLRLGKALGIFLD